MDHQLSRKELVKAIIEELDKASYSVLVFIYHYLIA